MKIKNIQQYRSFYKIEIRDQPTRDENFIGNFLIDKETGKKTFGWFEIYHGDKDGYGKAEAGIENFLQSFLDMAKDGQAVYEFLQNAVDAGSTHYTMVWGKDEVDGNYYLMVANNGRMFDQNSIRSILNVGSSTKTADSQSIGKFGIGFKLAHRLVGKDNGLQELINENSGPILFSWKNYELEKLASGSKPIPTELSISKNTKAELIINDDNPWLFKILITCFPCLPQNNLVQELPIMADGTRSISNPFSEAEYEVLSRWVKINQGILNKETYKEGALFFIKLGAGKETELAENNLKEGVKFALAILKETADSETKKEKTLHTVQLNNEKAITYPDLEYIKLTVHKEKEQNTYANIRFGVDNYAQLTPEQQKKIANEADIEALFGFRKHTEIGEYFKGAPNLYLYFPLSEEVHNFNYILHSNAFYKGSSRTFLHKGSSKEDGINERLLKTIVIKIDLELNRLSTSLKEEEREIFLHFYAALLTSGKSLNQDRLWIEAPYINPINELLKKYIPVRKSLNSSEFEIIKTPEKVFIKKTKIDIDTTDWGLTNVSWFYWTENDDINIRSSAIAKLGIKEYGLYNLLSADESIFEKINVWVKGEDAKIKTVLEELAIVDEKLVSEKIFKSNLFNIKLLKFNNEALLNINEFQSTEKHGYFIVYNKLNEIIDLLGKIDFKYSKENFDNYNFPQKYFSLFTTESQVRSYTILTKLFSKVATDTKLNTLTKEEKHRLFEAFRTLNDSPGERMSELKLLKNNNNNPVCFKNLFSNSDLSWLNKFCVNSIEDHADYKNYFLTRKEEIYEGIIYPFWSQIADFIAKNEKTSKEMLDSILLAYEKSNWKDKQKFLLYGSRTIIFQSKVIESENIFYDITLTNLPTEEFNSVQKTVLNYYGVHIPDKSLIPYLSKEPFSFVSSTISPKLDKLSVSQDIIDLLLFCKTSNIDFFGSNCIILSDGHYSINSTAGKKQIATVKSQIVKYIETYYPNEYVLIPDSFNDYSNKIDLSESKLVEHLIERFTEDDLEQELDFIDIILSERYEDKKKLLLKLTYVNLDTSWINERHNILYLRLLKDVTDIELTQEELGVFHKKIAINKENEQIIIGNIDSAHDSIEVTWSDKKIILSQSQILNLENADNIKLIQEFYDEAWKRDLLNQASAEKLFKISNAGITSDLVSRFNQNLDKKQLLNSHQVLFVLLSGKFNKEDYKAYKLKSTDGLWYDLENQLFIYSATNESHIIPAYLINEDYINLQSLLQLNDLEAFNYGDSEEHIIVSQFLFIKGCDPDILQGSLTISEKLDYLFKGWANISSSLKDNKRGQGWKKYLEISPNNFVLDGIRTKTEILPEDFIYWYNNEKKKAEFLRAIGVNGNESYLEKLRKYLLGLSQSLPDDFERKKFNDTVLLNTLNGLAGDFISLNDTSLIFGFNSQSSKILEIEAIINHLYENKAKNIPLLIHVTNNSCKVVKPHENLIYSFDKQLHEKLVNISGNNLSELYCNFNILKQTVLLNDKVLADCEDFPYLKTFIDQKPSIEHDEPFYRTWRDENKIRLLKKDEINYNISFLSEEVEYDLGVINEGNFYVSRIGENHVIYYNQRQKLEELSVELETDHKDISNALNSLIQSRDKTLASFYHAITASGRDEFDDEDAKRILDNLKKRNLEEERKDIIELIRKETRYSYIWFEKYIKYLLSFENLAETVSQKSISFEKIKPFWLKEKASSKYFILEGANSLIPLNIEAFEGFNISMAFNNQKKENIKVEGVSKKGQDLMVYIPQGIDTKIVNNFSNVVNITINFTPVLDLIKRLYDAFTNENIISPWENINQSLPPIHFIYGPPGTGKTTNVCELLENAYLHNVSLKALVLVPTNKAGDVIAKRLLAKGTNLSVVRIGSATDPELEFLDNEFYQSSLDDTQIAKYNVVITTIHRLPYYQIDNDHGAYYRLFGEEIQWDYIIFDEASMISLPYLVFAIKALNKHNKNAQFIVAGDPKQIPPVIDATDKDLEEMNMDDENVYRMFNINSFKPCEQILRPADTIENLTTQYRSVENIGKLFSEFAYENLLAHGRDLIRNPIKQLPPSFFKELNNPICIIDFPIDIENSVLTPKKLLFSSYHLYAGILTAEIIKHLDICNNGINNYTIGVVSPYKAQAMIMNKLILAFGISNSINVHCDTVHGFQGDECDIIIFVVNPNQYYHTGHPKALLSKEYIYNVANSRAKDYLWILSPVTDIPNNPFINLIQEIAKRNNKVEAVSSSKLEMELFKENNFIVNHSYLTGHDNINVFGQVDMAYFIKAGNNAIDIQLRK